MTQLRLSPAPLPTQPTQERAASAQVTHFLALPQYLDPADMEFLFQCREPRAAWEQLPRELVGGDVVEIMPGVIRLSPHAVVHGPYSPLVLATTADQEYVSVETASVSIVGDGIALDTGVLRLDQEALAADPATCAHPAGFPEHTPLVWALTCTRSRGEQPMPGVGDRDGLARIFAEGIPIRDEWRQVSSLVAVARYLGGSAHFDAGDSMPTRTYHPELDAERYRSVAPDRFANVDLTVHSDVWLAPEATMSICAAVNPDFAFMPTEVPWDGPAGDAGVGQADGVAVDGPDADLAEVLAQARQVLEPDLVQALRDQADEFDIAALQEPSEASAYGLILEGPKGDTVTVEVIGSTELPPALENVEWASEGSIEYRIRWLPADYADVEREIPSFELRQRRTRYAGVVQALARGIHAVTSGEVADQDGFLRDPAGL